MVSKEGIGKHWDGHWSERAEMKNCNRDGQKEGIGRNRDGQEEGDRKGSRRSGRNRDAMPCNASLQKRDRRTWGGHREKLYF